MYPASKARWPGLAAILLCLMAGGCSMSALGGGGVDDSLSTASVTATAPADPDRNSDEATIRNAVSSADLDTVGAQPLAWANAGTGARGAISRVVETKEAGTVCRKFTTTRERFDGVGLFSGKACMVSPGAWQLTAFVPN